MGDVEHKVVWGGRTISYSITKDNIYFAPVEEYHPPKDMIPDFTLEEIEQSQALIKELANGR